LKKPQPERCPEQSNAKKDLDNMNPRLTVLSLIAYSFDSNLWALSSVVLPTVKYLGFLPLSIPIVYDRLFLICSIIFVILNSKKPFGKISSPVVTEHGVKS